MNCPHVAVLAAIAMLSGHVVCLDCGAVELGFDEERDCPMICHPYADCPLVTDPEGLPAVALAEYVQDELGHYVLMADYGEPLPRHAWAVT